MSGLSEQKLYQSLKQLQNDFQLFSQKIPVVRQDFEQLVSNFDSLAQGVTSMQHEEVSHAGHLVEALRQRLASIIVVEIAELADDIKKIQHKSEVASGKIFEAAEGAIDLETQFLELEEGADRLKGRLANQQTMLKNLKYILSVDPDAQIELLNMIGPEVVQEWLDKQQETK